MLLPVFFLLALVAPGRSTRFDVRHVELAPRAITSPSQLPRAAADHVFPIIRQNPVSHRDRKRALSPFVKRSDQLASLFSTDFDEVYVLPGVNIGGQRFDLIIDAGSSDLWVVGKNFSCFGLDGSPQPQSECGFNSAGFDVSKSKTYKSYPNHSFNTTYVTFEFLAGFAGFDTVTVAGLSIHQQEFAVASYAAWDGAGVSASGVFGLGYPDLTSIYNGSDPQNATASHWERYLPFIFNAVAQRKISHPYFSISVDRGVLADELKNNTDQPRHGYLAFGGIPPVPVTSKSVTVPIKGYSVTPVTVKNHPSGGGRFYYTVAIDAFTFPGSHNITTRNNNTILNAGTVLSVLPTEVATAFNARFVPPATFSTLDSLFHVDCNATAPPFAVTIGGKTFHQDLRDQIVPSYNLDANGKRLCISGIQPGGEASTGAVFILGSVFLRNVVSTYDIASNKVTLTERQRY